MKWKKVVVTANDIEQGVRRSYCECPVARAVRRAFHAPAHRRIAVRREGVIVGDLEDERVWISDVPPQLQRFITNFDTGKRVRPTVFDLAFR